VSLSSQQETSAALLLHIRTIAPELNEQEQKVAQYVLAHAAEVVHLSVSETADRSGVSDATVYRFARRVGTDGYQDLKIRLAQELHLAVSRPYPELAAEDSVTTAIEKVFAVEAKSLEDTKAMLDREALGSVADALLGARRVDIYAVGGGSVAAAELAYRLNRLSIRAVACFEYESALVSAAQLGPGDVAVGISHSGEAGSIHRALEIAAQASAVSVALVNHMASPIAKLARFCLATAGPEIQEHGYPVGARVAQIAVVDALVTVMALKRPDAARESLERISVALSGRER
jgi:DNA-binding MurR/RpiR family transcriptional regulator